MLTRPPSAWPLWPSPGDGLVWAAGVILRQREHHSWLLLRSRKHGEWGFPKGHLEPGESLIQGALRECAEECGIAVLALHQPPTLLRYPLPDGRCKCVAYFAATTACQAVQLSSEHDRFLWAEAATVTRRLGHANLRRLFAASLDSAAVTA